jgi:hypothetical protein
MYYDHHRVFTRADLNRHAEDLGLLVTSCDDSAPGVVTVTVKEGPPSEVIRRPPLRRRVEILRERIAVGGAVGISWTVSLEAPAGSSLRRMKMNPLQTAAVVGAITLTVGAMIAILVYGFLNL